jgi:hypothetical protein
MNDLDIALESAKNLRHLVMKLPITEREDILIRIYKARRDIRLDLRHDEFTLWDGHTGYTGSLVYTGSLTEEQ